MWSVLDWVSIINIVLILCIAAGLITVLVLTIKLLIKKLKLVELELKLKERLE